MRFALKLSFSSRIPRSRSRNDHDTTNEYGQRDSVLRASVRRGKGQGGKEGGRRKRKEEEEDEEDATQTCSSR